ncbi:uL15m family ribosomal protein [Methanothrix sp.]|uniref:uL15m family ribosomal protein n=1 Tax=Methanothrix sp. TaxID=90426 RepID=UPI002353890F|nr:uL15m family ribosomal protein [Methanothrix sp.]
MVRPKTKEKRGHRTYHGKHKNMRGGGTRGGRGDSGKCKHVNVDELDQLAGQDGKVEINELKVLGRGRVTRKLEVKALGFTAAAKSKIEAAGGQAVVV